MVHWSEEEKNYLAKKLLGMMQTLVMIRRISKEARLEQNQNKAKSKGDYTVGKHFTPVKKGKGKKGTKAKKEPMFASAEDEVNAYIKELGLDNI